MHRGHARLMCGICGYAGFDPDASLLERMLEVLHHRGPDDGGSFVGDRAGLAMRRLSIIDVAHGHQPMWNEDRTVVVVMNGEIYNHRELARGLAERGHKLVTRSDTEAVVHLYEEEGIDCLRHLRGMFGLAIYDLPRRRLFLARDRIGIKPLYYWQHAGKLLFGSEIKAILECAEVERAPNLAAIDGYLRLRYVPGPETMFQGIHKLPPGHWLRYDDGGIRLERYWEPPLLGVAAQIGRSDQEYREAFAEIFQETVRLHLESDVPVGSYLSGGLDSSLLTAEMSRSAGAPVHTFAVGFDWQGDETAAAADVSRVLGTTHHEIVCRPADLAILPRLIWHADEPLGDPIILPSYLLAKAASDHVKVVLTGEGADEFLAGYLFHRVMSRARQARGWFGVPFLRHIAAPLVRKLPLGLLDKFFDYPASLGEGGRRRLAAFVASAAGGDPSATYELLISLFDRADLARLYAPGASITRRPGPPASSRPQVAGASFLEQVLWLQYQTWLPDNILARQDKMSMASSVEARVPFLDHVLVEFLAGVPPHLKLDAITGRNKILARDYAKTLLPAGVAARPKQAFYIPTEGYFSSPGFREMVADCLSPGEVKRRGYFDPDAVATLVEVAERSGEFVAIKQVLALVMLTMWHRIFIDREPGWRTW